MPTVRIGLSGWRYADWRGPFYPAGLPQRRELEHVASVFPAVELNGSFYSLQRPSSFVAWREQTPEGFTFAVKGPRFVTHMKRLRDVRTPLANFFASGVLALDDRLGPVLWQLPARTTFDAGLLDEFLALLPRSTAEAARLAREHDDRLRAPAWTEVGADRPLVHALEPRHASFASAEALDVLRRHRVAFAISDGAGHWPLVEAITSRLVYVRLHGDTSLYTSGYRPHVLDAWAARVRGWCEAGHDVEVYLDNDVHAHAPADALALMSRLPGLALPGTGPTPEPARGRRPARSRDATR
ncbi:DUF72 domain-containing protein [Cellulosimicrobium cellulans]|uniref:DUF72 domain-containing protein n=1 Tax=Cellulosimicrobium cellulans TaxID=1710 RepID=UPI00209810AC|nr:DUF72 domain-containing protein [Cellulosimicrobium cellulans]MCO7272565.1 DUF72 domain-containing protein [Cellulosimicrobium cellulans]